MLVTIHLVDILDATSVGKCRADIISRVKELYTPCFDLANLKLKGDAKHSFAVTFATAKPTPSDTDLIVYLLPATFYSIITYDETKHKANNLLGDHWGLTKITPAKGTTPAAAKTEVICKSAQGAALGSLVVHEILHAKTGKGNAGLHPTGGLGAASVAGDTVLNNQNKSDIATTITKPVTPWLGGWDILISAKQQRDSGDPTWDLF